MGLQMRIILLFFVIVSSDAEEVKSNLTGTEGGSVTLPDPVLEHGFLSFGTNIIAAVTERKILIYEDIYKDKLLYDINNGHLTVTGLQRNDSGIYTINSKKRKVFTTSYKLTVYESVPRPAVKRLNGNADSCILLCFVEKETTLSWYKDKEIVNQSSSAFSLLLNVHKQDFNSSYRCVAANPVENKTSTVNVTALCAGQNKTEESKERHYAIPAIVIPIASAVFVILVAIIIKVKYFSKNKRTTTQTEDSVNRDSDVQYTDVRILEGGHNQGQNPPDSAGPVDRSNLTTVYDQLEAHRMVPADTADHVYDQTRA